MKKLFISASLFLVSLAANAQKIETANTIVDCGQTVYQSPATAEFEVINKGNHPTRITDVRMSCGCTDVEYPKGVIPADGKFTVNGTGYYTLLVTTQDRQTIRILLYIEQ